MTDPRERTDEGTSSVDHAGTTRERISTNVVVSMSTKLLYLVTRFFIPPFVLAHVGLEAYGIWATAFILVSYLGVSTFGISNVFTKYVAEYSAKSEFHKANAILSAGTLATLAVCSLLFVLTWWFWPAVVDFLEISKDLEDEARSVVLIVVAVFLASIALSAFHDTLAGLQRIAATQSIWVAAFLVEIVLIVILVGSGRGIRGMAEAYLVRTVIEIGAAALVVYRTEPWFSLSPRHITREAYRVIVRFGGMVQALGFLAIGVHSADRALAAPLLGVQATGLMDIGKKLPGMASMIPSVFANVFVPAASYLHGGLETDASGREHVSKLYLKGARYMNIASGYLCAFLAALPLPILDAWLGQRYPGATLLMVLFSVSTQVHLLTGPGTSILKGIGRPADEAWYLVPNVVLLAALVPASYLVFGAWTLPGIALAVVCSTLLSAAWFLRHANRLMRVSLATYLRMVIWPGIAPYIVGLALSWPVYQLTRGLERWDIAGVVVGAGIVYTMIFGLVTYFFVFERGERYWFQAIAANKLRRFLPGSAAP